MTTLSSNDLLPGAERDIRSDAAAQTKKSRHDHKLSLNFPVLPPLQPQSAIVGLHTTSPLRSPSHGVLTSHSSSKSPAVKLFSAATAASNTPSTSRSSSVAPKQNDTGTTLSGIQSVGGQEQHPSSNPSVDFLTLIAAQERRVLELREELHRAEKDLEQFKKQWAVGEAKRKNAEIKRSAVPLKRLSGGQSGAQRGTGDSHEQTEVAASPTGVNGVAERQTMLERRKTMMERNHVDSESSKSRSTNAAPGVGRQISRRSQQRVFSSSRHTRTLSLLTTPVARRDVQGPSQDENGSRSASLDEATAPMQSSSGDLHKSTRTPIQRTASLIEDASNNALSFNKAYANLAANRKSVPPGAEIWMRQGQKVAEGLKEGLWNLIEDIRQATVGEEGISGAQTPVSGGVQHRNDKSLPAQRQAAGGPGISQDKPTSFWRDFGVDTPGKSQPSDTNSATSSTRRGRQKSKTPKTARPARAVHRTEGTVTDLLVDLGGGSTITNDDDEEEDEWEPWESPAPEVATDGIAGGPRDQTQIPKQDGSLPWPELKTPVSPRSGRYAKELMGLREGATASPGTHDHVKKRAEGDVGMEGVGLGIDVAVK